MVFCCRLLFIPEKLDILLMRYHYNHETGSVMTELQSLSATGLSPAEAEGLKDNG